MSQEKVRVSPWVIGIGFSLIMTIMGGAVVWGQVRADVESIKSEIRDIKPYVDTVTTLKTEVPNLSRRIDEMRDEMKDIKQVQAETQRDVKTILTMLRRAD